MIVGYLLSHLISLVRLKLYDVIKFRAKLKTAQLAIYPSMSRHKIVCRDILKLWEDKLSSCCDINPIFLSLIPTKLRYQFLSRPKISVATSIFVVTLSAFALTLMIRQPFHMQLISQFSSSNKTFPHSSANKYSIQFFFFKEFM